jgi:hypothetical protein
MILDQQQVATALRTKPIANCHLPIACFSKIFSCSRLQALADYAWVFRMNQARISTSRSG